MTDWLEQLKTCAAAGDADAVRNLINQGIQCAPAEYERVLHRSFQIQPGSMAVPPHPDVIAALADADVIAPVFRALYRQDVDALNQLLTDDPSSLEQLDASGHTPLLRAAELCKPAILQCLLSHSPNLAATRDPGFGPMHLAAWSEVHPDERVQTLRLLAEAGCEIDARSKEDATPLMLAALCFKENSVACLLELGADPALVSVEDKTALDYARDSNHQPAIALLS